MNEITYDLRFRFGKEDEAVYLSHLDLNRIMARAIRRSDLPVWYTKGFNPHPYLWFGPPLSLGYAGEKEVLDISFTCEIDCDEAASRLGSRLPLGISIKSAGPCEHKISDIAFAKYRITLDDLKLENEIREYLGRDEVMMLKKSKRGEREVNILSLISSFEVSGSDSGTAIDSVVCADGTNNLNPGLIVSAIERDLCGGQKLEFEIVRKEFYLADGSIFK